MIRIKIVILICILILHQQSCISSVSVVLNNAKRKDPNANKLTHLVTYNEIINTLTSFEIKLLDGKLTEDELNLIFKLKLIMDKQKRKMKAPAVYWYSRQGR